VVFVSVSQLVLILAGGLLAARVGRAFRVPEAIPLLIAGYVLGGDLLGVLKPAEMGISIDMVALFAVPIILFYDGLKTDAKSIKENAWAVLSITTIAVVVTVVGIGFFSNFFLGLSWPASLVLGAILASTDPASIIPVLRKLSIKKKISTVLEAETALNDATAITIFTVALGLAAGGEVGLRQGLSQFVYLTASSIVLGGLIGLAFYELFKRLRVETDLVFASFIVLLVAYGFAEFFNTSSVITIVFSALVFRAYLQSTQVNASSRLHTLEVWEDVNFMAIALVFLVLASAFTVAQAGPYLVVGVLIALAFMFVVRPLTIILSLFFDKSFAFREKIAIAWLGSPRGVVSAALAGIVLGKAANGAFPSSEAAAIFNITVIVIVVTVTISSLTATAATRALLHASENTIEDEYKRLSTELKTMMVASRRFRDEWKEGLVNTKIYDELNRKLNEKIKRIDVQLELINRKAPHLKDTQMAIKAREILIAQIAALGEAYENKELPEKEYTTLLKKLRAQADTLSEIAQAPQTLKPSNGR